MHRGPCAHLLGALPPEEAAALEAHLATCAGCRAERDDLLPAATGLPAEPRLQVDTARAIPRDSLSGSLDASGTLAGNVKRFDLRGTAAMRASTNGALTPLVRSWLSIIALRAAARSVRGCS